MPKFSISSMKKLGTVHTDLELVMMEVIKQYDITVLCGLRGEEEQNNAYKNGLSKLKYPESRHNRSTILNTNVVSDAVDVAPYPIDWADLDRFYFLAGLVFGVAGKLKEDGKITHNIRWGGDWDQDMNFTDNTFNDLVHFELVT